MRRPGRALAVAVASLALLAAAEPGLTPPELEALGWRKLRWEGIRPARFGATPSGGVRIHSQGEGGFLARPVNGSAACLTWRWRVDAGPPPTDLARRGGDDRAVAIAIGFAGFGPQAGFALRARHAVAQAAVGEMKLPRSVLVYAWGGTGQEGARHPHGFFPSPWSGEITQIRVQRPARAPRGQWVQERVDLGADWRRAFGPGEVPPLLELVVSTDTDDTGARVEAAVEDIRLVPCS